MAGSINPSYCQAIDIQKRIRHISSPGKTLILYKTFILISVSQLTKKELLVTLMKKSDDSTENCRQADSAKYEAGEKIPLVGRTVAHIDIFDTLTWPGCSKQAFFGTWRSLYHYITPMNNP
jgi:hypothetical protein